MKKTLITQAFAFTAILVLFAGEAPAQPTYSIDVQGPTAGGGFVSEADILTPIGAGIAPPPAVVIPGGPAGLGIGVTAIGFRELDALSYGTDPLLLNTTPPVLGVDWSFSVDEFAVGLPGVPFPSVTTEGAFSPVGEASADIYSTLTGPGPVGLFFGGNTGIFDGNGGATPFPAPGLNLVEPNPPAPFATDSGDNLDAWDIDQPPPPAIPGTAFPVPVYYSLDSDFPDPLEGIPFNTSTALANGFVGGDVLVSTIVGAGPALFAPAFDLGLDLTGTDTDDLDALVLWENGNGAWDPTMGPYSWTAGSDMLLYSVRRGSALIGVADALLGIGISEGDVLVPMGPGAIPGIFVPAEVLGLATLRSVGAAGTFQGHNDDLDALDVLQRIVPEPASIGLLGLGMAMLLGRRKRNN